MRATRTVDIEDLSVLVGAAQERAEHLEQLSEQLGAFDHQGEELRQEAERIYEAIRDTDDRVAEKYLEAFVGHEATRRCEQDHDASAPCEAHLTQVRAELVS